MPRAAPHGDSLAAYRAKRRFDRTPEPQATAGVGGGNLYTIQKHAARRLHFDLRLELDGVLKSWAVTRGPSLNPADKRLAVRTEDHPVAYATFEGRIPEGNYGAGSVLLWDRGEWRPLDDPRAGLEKGRLTFELHGERLRGRWALVRLRGDKQERRENWLLVKEKDAEAEREADVTAEHETSIASGRTMEEIAAAPEAVWHGEEDSAQTAKPPDTVNSSQPERSRKKKRGGQSALPGFVEPALPTLVDEAPSGKDWLFEVKFDGYRAVAAVLGEEVRIYSRSGFDWTGRYPTITRALADLDLNGVLLDGEVVAFDAHGRSDFSALQRTLKGGGGAGLSYFVFDFLAKDGESLRDRPLKDRKAKLKTLLEATGRSGPIFYSDHIEGDSTELLETLCPSGFEGILAKRANAPYRPGRGRSWLKVKCGRDQEFVVVGWSPSNTNRPFSSLLLATRDGDQWRYAGRVGSGFSAADLELLSERLRKRARKTPPVAGSVPSDVKRNAQWVKPELVVQISFAEFTGDGLLRQARFLGLREDKPAESVTRDVPQSSKGAEAMSAEREAAPSEETVGGVRLSNPDKVLYPQQGVTKRELALYLEAVAERMLPHLSDRLLSLVRCPQGRAKKCFFQRHGGAGLSEGFHRQSIAKKSGGEEEYLYLKDVSGLLAAAQMGVLEFHIWGSRIDDIDRPDRLVFDLDPDPSVAFAEVKGAAVLLRDALEALGLKSFPLLTGGKGIHVVAPLVRRHEWPTIKAFAKALSERVAENDPERYVATMSKAKRTGRIFIDYFRNDRSATAIAPYSPRAHEGAPLAWPVGWEELQAAPSADVYPLRNADPGAPDAWADYHRVRQSLKAASLCALGVSTAAARGAGT